MAVAESEIEVEQSRWVVAVAGVAMQLLLGTVYAWTLMHI